LEILIIKLGAAGDVVRTTTLLRVLDGDIDWVTDDTNVILLKNCAKIRQCIPWSRFFNIANKRYDLVINLEDSFETANLLRKIRYQELFGAHLNSSNKLTYTKSSSEWFDLSLISKYGKNKADELKFRNRKTYQEMIFKALGFSFNGEPYYLPDPIETDLAGDIAIAPQAGSVWPMKNWAYYEELKARLEQEGYAVNYLPMRDSLLEHIGDVKNHRFLVSGDTLPMHIALGCGIKCITLFTCTSPWEIYDYGVQKKIVSPLLGKHFYQRGFAKEATTSISVNRVYEEVLNHLNEKPAAVSHSYDPILPVQAKSKH
jgi:heptosyltransferase-2